MTLYLQDYEQLTLWVVSSIAASLSVAGSSFLLFATSYRWSIKKFSSPRDRILMGMSFLDIFASISAIIGPMASPQDTKGMNNNYGNTATCTMQAFWTQLGAGVPLYNGMLAIYYTMTIVFMIRDVNIQQYAEWFFHLIPLTFAFGTASAGVVLEIFNSNLKFCWVDSKPPGCEYDPAVECERGEDAAKYLLPFAGYPLVICFVLVTACMVMISVSFARQSNAISTYNGSHKSPSDLNKITSAVFVQSLLFIFAFLLTYVWGFSIKVMRYTGKDSHFALRVLNRCFLPLQGFWNLLIFLRPTFVRIRAQMIQERGKRFWCGCCFQFLWRALRAESVDFVPPALQQRSSLLLNALQKSVKATNKRRRSGSSFGSSFADEFGSTETLGKSSELGLPRDSDVESIESNGGQISDETADDLARYLSSPEGNIESVMQMLESGNTRNTSCTKTISTECSEAEKDTA